MKKVLALSLVLTLLLSTFSFALADPNKIGQELKQLGVIKGDSSGNLNTQNNITREEALVTLARMLGVENAAKSTVTAPSFSDVPVSEWSRPYIAYAEIKGWTNGIGGGKFGLGQKVTAQQYVTYMLRALGYGSTPYAKSMTKAKELGLLDELRTVANGTELTRGDVFVIMYNTLNTKPSGKDVALVYQLGLKEMPKPDVKVAGIKSVDVSGLKQIIIHLTAPVKTAGDENNYELETDGEALLNASSKYELSSDKMTITLTLSRAAEQQEKVNLTIEDILEKDVTLKDLQFLDMTIPKVVSAKVVGADAIKVTFSEPMKDGLLETSNYSINDIDGDKIYVKSATATDNNTAVIIELYSDLEKDGTVIAKNVEDYNGLTALAEELKYKFSKDTAAPKIVSYSNASMNKVTLVFDEEIEVVEGVSSFYHTNTSNTADKVVANGKELTLTFDSGDELPGGTAYIYIKSDAIRDLWDNYNDKIVQEIKVAVDKDEPAVSGGVKVLAQNKIKVTFNEDIYKTSGYSVKLYKGGDREKISVSTDISEDELVLTFSESLYGDYKLVLEGIKDASGNEIDQLSVNFDMDDETAPNPDKFKATAYDINEDIQKIIVNFNDEMKTADILDKTNYMLKGLELNDSDVTIKALDNNEKVQISFSEDFFNLKASHLSDSNNNLLTIARMSDANGNKMEEFSVTLDVQNGDDSTVAVKSVNLVAKDRVEFTAGDQLAIVTIEQFVIYKGGTKLDIASTSKSINDDGNTVVSIKLAADLSTDPASDRLNYVILSEAELHAINKNLDPSQNKYGQKLNSQNGDVTDKCAPELDYIQFVDEGTIHVVFTEDLDGGYLSRSGSNGFKVSGGTLNKATMHDTKDNIVVITGEDFTVNTDVYYSDSNDIADDNGNLIESFDHTAKLLTKAP